jgi:hypothetical protein
VERDGPLLRDRRHCPVLIPEAVGGLRGAGSAPRAERGSTNRQEHHGAGQPPDPIDPVRVRPRLPSGANATLRYARSTTGCGPKANTRKRPRWPVCGSSWPSYTAAGRTVGGSTRPSRSA